MKNQNQIQLPLLLSNHIKKIQSNFFMKMTLFHEQFELQTPIKHYDLECESATNIAKVIEIKIQSNLMYALDRMKNSQQSDNQFLNINIKGMHSHARSHSNFLSNYPSQNNLYPSNRSNRNLNLTVREQNNGYNIYAQRQQNIHILLNKVKSINHTLNPEIFFDGQDQDWKKYRIIEKLRVLETQVSHMKMRDDITNFRSMTSYPSAISLRNRI